MNYILQTNNLTKKYKSQLSVDNLCININDEDIYGLIGKNGAGKTTTLKMILGLINPTSGNINIFGKNVSQKDRSYLQNIGSIIEFPSSYENLTAYENLKLHCDYLKLNYSENKIDQILDTVDLLKYKNKKVKEFSLGMKQRLGIARAISHKPKLLILDEPTNGLDPLGIRDFRTFITNLVMQEHLTVIISSHILSELELLVTRIGIIDKGHLLKESSIKDVQNKYLEYVDIKVDNVKETQSILKNHLGFNSILTDNNYLRITSKYNEIHTNTISKTLIDNHINLFELVKHKENLEDYFLKISGGSNL